MPIGTDTIASKDRPVIVVASTSEIKRLVLDLAGKQVGKTLLFPVSSLIEGNLFNTFRTIGDALSSTPEEQFLVALEKVLDLKHNLYWYELPEAKKLFKFDIGYTPKDGDILVQHPIDPDLYIVPTDYSRRFSREKEAAFRQIAAALGAKELRLINAEIIEQRGFLDGSFSVKQAATQIGIRADFDKSESLVKNVYSRFSKPDSFPRVPPDLQQWVDLDPDLKTMVRGRLETNLEYDRVTLEFSEGMGIGGEIAAKLARQGLSFGSKYERVFHSVWHYEVEYWSKE